MRRLPAIPMVLLAAAAMPAGAAVIAPVRLAPPSSELGYTVFALGIIPITATFRDFSGSLVVDPRDPKACEVRISVRIASLHMADPARNKLALSPAVLDAAHYPIMQFVGRCAQADAAPGRPAVAELAGELTLHGVTRPLTLEVKRDGTNVTATGMLLRHDYGIGGLQGMVGQRIRFRLAAKLPAEIAALP